MIDLIIVGLIVAGLVAALAYNRKAKKSGKGCSGCSRSNCGYSCTGVNNSENNIM